VKVDRNGKPSVSVVILSHNYGHDLARAARSVFEQTYAPLEIVILDVGSNDNTWDVARQIAREATPIPVRVEQLANVGPSIARNRGAAMTCGEFLLFLDADDYLSPQYLSKTVPILASKDRASLVYVDSQMFGDQIGRWSVGPYDFKQLCRVNMFNYCVLLRRAAFDQVGGFDEENFGYYEDWELWIRLGKHGWDAVQLYEPLFFYQSHFNTSLMSSSKRLDKIYRAYIVNRHPELYNPNDVQAAKETLVQAPPGWHRRPPMKGVENMQRLTTQFPNNPHILYFLGMALLQECRPHEAVTVLERLLQSHPEDADTKVALHKARRLAPYSRDLPATAVAHMKGIKGCINRNDFNAARDRLARCIGELLDISKDDPRLKQAANVAMKHTLDVADDWQRLAENRERLIHELRDWIAQLTTGKEWLEKQWRFWEQKAREDNKVRWWQIPSKSAARFRKSERPVSKTTN
jgi:GT2 family glycosyltransferase